MLVGSEEGTATRHNELSRLALEPIKPQSERNSVRSEELSSLSRHGDRAARKSAVQGVGVGYEKERIVVGGRWWQSRC